MRLYTQLECEKWLSGQELIKPTEANDLYSQRVPFPSDFHRIFFAARWVASALPHDMAVMLWITEWGIWPSSENLHLYYRLRQSYNDHRLLHEAPGHFFLKHESEDLASFLQLAMLNGWGGFVLAEANDLNAFFSHDEYIDFYAPDEASIASVREAFPSE